MKSIGATIAALKRNVETFMGMSEGTYQQEEGEPKLGGMVQGKADVPQLSTQQSDVMLRAHKSRCHGVTITSPGMNRAITHHSIAYADDTDGQVSSDTTESTLIPKIVRKLQHSGQTWSNLTSICGGLIAHHNGNYWLGTRAINLDHERTLRKSSSSMMARAGTQGSST